MRHVADTQIIVKWNLMEIKLFIFDKAACVEPQMLTCGSEAPAGLMEEWKPFVITL